MSQWCTTTETVQCGHFGDHKKCPDFPGLPQYVIKTDNLITVTGIKGKQLFGTSDKSYEQFKEFVVLKSL